MAYAQHNTLDGDNAHTPFRWNVADEAARLALSPGVAELYKWCYVQSTTGIWVLTNTAPVTWKQVDQAAAGVGTVKVTAADTTDEPLDSTIVPGTLLNRTVLNPGANEQYQLDVDEASIDHTNISNIGTNSHATIDTHLANTSNPHTVTAAQVGNGTAQWNADKLQGRDVWTAAPNDGDMLIWDNGNTRWTPSKQIRSWTLTGGWGGVGGNTTNVQSMGHNAAINGVPMIRAGRIIGISIAMTVAATGGVCQAQALINGVAQTGAGETVDIDLVNTTDNFQLIPTPIPYNAGDVIHMQTVTTGFTPTGSDSTVTLFMEDT